MPKLITPASSFYLIDTALTSPRIDVNGWKLSVKGAVDNPVEFSYKELLGMSTREADITLSCVSNEVGGGLVSNGRWTGVLLSDVLAEAGVARDKITRSNMQLVGRSVDGFTAGWDGDSARRPRGLVAFGLNGSELPSSTATPCGSSSPASTATSRRPVALRDATHQLGFRRVLDPGAPGRRRAYQDPVRIDTVMDGDQLSAGTVQVGGIAWAPHRGIERVEVSTDGGETWNEARLARQLDIDTWRQWIYEWNARPGQYSIQVRAQTARARPRPPARPRRTPPAPPATTPSASRWLDRRARH